MNQFPTLPFGLASPSRIFTKLIKPEEEDLLQRLGVKLIIYLDDIASYQGAKRNWFKVETRPYFS